MTLDQLINTLQQLQNRFDGNVEVRLTTAMQWPSVCQSSVQLIDNEVAGVLVSSEDGDLGALEMFPPEADAEAVHIVMGSQLQCGMAEEWSVIDQNVSVSAGQRD